MHRWEGGPSKGTEQDSPAEWRLWPFEIPRNKTTKKGINQILSVFGDMKRKKQKKEMKIRKKIRRRGNPAIRVLSAPVTHDAICIEMKKSPVLGPVIKSSIQFNISRIFTGEERASILKMSVQHR